MWTLAYLYVWAFSFLLSLFAVNLCLKLASRFQIFDEPGPRKIQTRPVPLLGGLGMILAFYGTLILNLALLKMVVHLPALSGLVPREIMDYVPSAFKVSGKLLAILVGSILVFLIGLVDDFRELGAWPKLAVQIVAAVILWTSGLRITFFSQSAFLSLILTVFWVVAITNAFNLLDNMDGLSTGVASISSVFLLMISVSQNEYFVSLFLSAWIGCLLGFLVFNFHPAKIFMGDAGSYFVGFLMASGTIAGTYYFEDSSTLFSVLMPVLILGLPLYDLSSVVFIRIYERRPIYRGDKKHFSHRLMNLGMSPKGAVLFLYLVSFAFGASSLLLGMVEEWGLYLIFLQALAFVAIVALLEYFGRRNSGK